MAYSYDFKLKAIARLAATGNDYDKVSEEMGVSVRTLYRWAGTEDPRMAEFLEEIVKELLENIPRIAGKDFAIFMGILLDKLLLFKGEATARTESKSTAVSSQLDGLTLAQLEEIKKEADEFLESLAAGVNGKGD